MSIFESAARMFGGGGPEAFKNISVDELAAMVAARKKMVILDVREPAELAAFGAIKGVVNVSVRDLSERLNELPSDKSTPIVVVCQTGSRSRSAARLLATRAGYTDVSNLEGGTMTWMRHGQPTVRVTPKNMR